MNQRELFLRHIAQTSTEPLALEIVKAEGNLLYDGSGKEYLDCIGGISVANVGHRHPKVIEAIQHQLNAYLHIMVYGEFVETPQVQYAKFLTDHLPGALDSVFFTNSGAEAVEGAMKLAKRVTNRSDIIAFNSSYHGSTQGALSIMGDEYWRNSFRPLLPAISHLDYNTQQAVDAINEKTACVILETVQGEAGIVAPSQQWMHAIREKCTQTGALLILDEIQAGFGRTGKLWGFEHFGIEPDVLLLGKALGGGMPLGAFIAPKAIMNSLTSNPVLGHITTFGGHPVSCAAGLAAMKVLIEEKLIDSVKEKENLFRSLLVHPRITAIRSFGLWMAVEFESTETARSVIEKCIEQQLLTDWFLFAPQCLRISPPLTLTLAQIKKSAGVIITSLDSLN